MRLGPGLRWWVLPFVLVSALFAAACAPTGGPEAAGGRGRLEATAELETTAGVPAGAIGATAPAATPTPIAPAATPTPAAQSTATSTNTPELSDVAQMLRQHAPTFTPAPGAELDSLLFVSRRDGTAQIYRMNTDGSEQVRLTLNGRDNTHPRWSPDGQQIAYLGSAVGEERPRLYLMAADGSGSRDLLPQFDEIVEFVRWSPDGRRLAFVANQGPPGEAFSSSDVYLVNRDGSGFRQLTNMGSGTVGCDSPTWSPDGSQLALLCRGLMQVSVSIIDLDSAESIGADFGQVFKVEWLPSGQHIGILDGMCLVGAVPVYALHETEEFWPFPCLELDFDNLGIGLASASDFAWSPLADTQFALQGEKRLQVIDLGKYRGAEFDYPSKRIYGPPSWSPAADRIAFAADGGEDLEIYVLDLASGEVVQLTDNQADDYSPTWGP